MATLIRVRDRIVNLDQMVSADMDEEHRVILYMTPVEGEGTAVGKEQVAVVFHGDEAACVRWALEGAADDTWNRWQRHMAERARTLEHHRARLAGHAPDTAGEEAE